MNIPLLAGCTSLMLTLCAQAEVSYQRDIKPVWDARCAACHGSQSPEPAAWEQGKDQYKQRWIGPRMDSYDALYQYVTGSKPGALMRQLDNGMHNGKGKPGGMYTFLGDTEQERQANLALFQRWIGTEVWASKLWYDKPGTIKLDAPLALPR